MLVSFLLGTSYKFRVVAVNVIGSSPPSAPSKAYTVVGGRTHERPVDGPYITYNEAINETTIILKWTVRVQGMRNVEKYISVCLRASYFILGCVYNPICLSLNSTLL